MSRRSTSELRSSSQLSSASGDGGSAGELLVAGLPDGDDTIPIDETGSRSALQVLDELFADGKISGKKMAQLRDSYSQLSTAVAKVQQKEADLMNEAKTLTQEMSSLEADLADVETFPGNEATEVGQQRQLLLKHRNALALIEERQEKLTYETELLTQERDGLKIDYERMPKPEEVKAQVDRLQQVNTDLREQRDQRQAEVAALKAELSKVDDAVSSTKEERERALYMQVEVKDELVKARSGPSSLQRQCTALLNEKKELESSGVQLIAEHNASTEEAAELTSKLNKLTVAHDQLKEHLKQRQDHNARSQREFSGIAKALENSKEEEIQLAGEKLQLELELEQVERKKQRAFEETGRVVKEKDTSLKMLKLCHMRTTNMQEAVTQALVKKEKLAKEISDLREVAAEYEEAERKAKYTHEVVLNRSKEETKLTEAESKKLREVSHNERVLHRRIGDAKDLLRVVNREHVRVTKERNEQFRLLNNMKNQVLRQENQVFLLGNEATDLQKYLAQTEESNTQFRQLHDALKAERSKLVQMLILSQRQMVEFTENIRYRGQEADILKKDLDDMSKLITRSDLRYQSSSSTRDVLKREVSKLRASLLDLTTACQEKSHEVMRMMAALRRTDQEMGALRQRFDQSISQRNDRGIGLVSANEDASCFYEHLNVKEKQMRDAQLALDEKEDEIRFLEVELLEEKRHLEVVRASIPNKRRLDNELVEHQIQLEAVRDQRKNLEREVTNPSAERISFLSGVDPGVAELDAKKAEVEMMLEDKEKQLYEKTLMLGEINRLVKEAYTASDSTKSETLAEAKKINDLRTKLANVNRKLMAHVAELTVQQTNLAKTRQEVEDQETILTAARTRAEMGLAPTDEMELEWMKQCERAEEKARRELEAFEEASDVRVLDDGTVTTAEYRINAYEAPSAQLGEGQLLSKPFGGQGYFKPTKGGGMRNIRKPVPKPIEI